MFLLECKSRVSDSINIIIEYNFFIFSNMFLSVSNEMNNLNYTGISTSPELQGRQLLTTTAAGISYEIQEPLKTKNAQWQNVDVTAISSEFESILNIDN